MVIDIAQLALTVGIFVGQQLLSKSTDLALDAIWKKILDAFKVRFPDESRLLQNLEKDPRNERRKSELIDSLSKQLAADENFRRQISTLMQELVQSGWVMPSIPPPTALYQLAADIPEFTGREQEMTAILQEAEVARTSSSIVVVTGFGGTGKSALALHAAHALKDRYCDVQLYVNLHGADAHPYNPQEVLTDFLRALGVEEANIPREPDARETKYRSLLANRKALILLDNARDEEQLRSLIPGGNGCFVLITSRYSLTGLDGVALRLELDVLTDADALALLVRWIGDTRFAAEREAAAKIVRLCGNLPLAVRIVGGQLRLRPALLQQYGAELEDADRRLEILQLDDRAVRASFMLSYQNLSPWEARLFRLLGLLHGESFSPQAAVALDGGKEEYVSKVLGRLVDAQLIGPSGTRYSIHDLMHLLARERLAEEKADDQDAARRRLAGWLGEESRKMGVWLSPDTRAKKIKELATAGLQIDRKDTSNFFNALNWFELEKGNLLASVEYAYRFGEWELTWQLAINSAVFYNLRSHWADWERTHVLALDATRRQADTSAEGVVLNLLGNVYRHQGRWEQAANIFRQALELNRKLGNITGESIALNLLANVHRLQGHWQEACLEFKEALELNIQHDNPYGRAIALGGLGNVYRMQGRWEEALQAYEECLRISERLDDDHGRTIHLNMKGQVLLRLGRLKEAEAALNEGLRLSRAMKSSKGECIALRIVGEMDMTRLDWEAAYQNLTSSLRIARQNNDKRCSSQTLMLLGEWHIEQENWDEAETCFADARSIVKSMDDRHDEGLVLQSLGRLRFEQGRDAEAIAICREALTFLNTSSPECAEVQAWLEKTANFEKKKRFFLQA